VANPLSRRAHGVKIFRPRAQLSTETELMTAQNDNAHKAAPAQTSAQNAREKRRAEALRANLRRRKAAHHPRESSPDAADASLSERAMGGADEQNSA
jgi:hypothetical protein